MTAGKHFIGAQMIFDLLLVGSFAGYLTHRLYRSFAESLSELTWISLGVVSAVVLASPTAVTLRLGALAGDGLANAIGFVLVSLVFLGLRYFFRAVHRRQAGRPSADSPDLPAKVNIPALIPALASALITMSFGIVLISAMPAPVLPGGEAALHGSALASGILGVAGPIRPSVNGLVVDAWKDSERLISGRSGAAQVAAGEVKPSLFPDKEWELLSLVNATRISKGLVPLVVEPRLRTEARRQVREMIELQFFAHESPTKGDLKERLNRLGLKYSVASENLANARSVEQAFDALMKSESHRHNILNPQFRKTGIGASRLDDGPISFSQVFTD